MPLPTLLPSRDILTHDLIVKKKEIEIDQKALSNRIKEMIESSMIFSQLKQQPAKLISRKKELEEEQERIKASLENLDENYKITMSYIQSEENVMRTNQEHI